MRSIKFTDDAAKDFIGWARHQELLTAMIVRYFRCTKAERTIAFWKLPFELQAHWLSTWLEIRGIKVRVDIDTDTPHLNIAWIYNGSVEHPSILWNSRSYADYMNTWRKGILHAEKIYNDGTYGRGKKGN